MHYYSFNIADYRKDTVHLSPIEHYIYRTLIDWYYLDEEPIPDKQSAVLRRLGLEAENKPELANVLSDFFILNESGWRHKRIDKDISGYRANCEKNKVNGKKGGRPKKQQVTGGNKPKETQSVILANPNETQINPNQEPRTKNQEPETINQEPVKAKALSDKPDHVLEIFGYWQDVMGRPQSKLTPKRKKAISGRLKEGYTVDEIRAAIDGCSRDPFSMGQNDRQTVYNDIELICRTGEKLESFTGYRPAFSEFGLNTQKTINNIIDVELS